MHLIQKTLAITKDSAQELNNLAKSANLVLTSWGWEKLLPKLAETINLVEKKSEQVIGHSFRKLNSTE